MLYTILIVILVLALISALPAWPIQRGLGCYPTGGFGIVILILSFSWLRGVYSRFRRRAVQ